MRMLVGFAEHTGDEFAPGWSCCTDTVGQTEPQLELRALYEAHFDLVWACLSVHGVARDEREDLVQEVWLVAHRRLSRLRGDASARAWLWSIALNVARLHRRASHRRDRKLRAIAAVWDVEPPKSPRHDDRVAAEQMLRELPVEQRDVLVLSQHVGYSGPEIAELLGVSLNTVHSRLRLAKTRLRTLDPPEDTRQARRRCWAVLAVGLGAAPESLLASGWVKVAALVVLALTTIAWTHAPTPEIAGEDGSRLAVARVATTPRPPIRSPGRVAVGGAPHSSPVLEAVSPSLDPSSPVPATDEKQDASTSSASRSAPAIRSTPSPHPASLSDDVEVLQRGLKLHRAGQYRRALATFERHARRFPGSPVWDAREGGRIRTLCALGRTDEAKTRADQALAAGGSNIALKNSLASCSSETK